MLGYGARRASWRAVEEVVPADRLDYGASAPGSGLALHGREVGGRRHPD
jgi:hypothetical protein